MSGDHETWDNTPPVAPNQAPKPEKNEYRDDRVKHLLADQCKFGLTIAGLLAIGITLFWEIHKHWNAIVAIVRP